MRKLDKTLNIVFYIKPKTNNNRKQTQGNLVNTNTLSFI